MVKHLAKTARGSAIARPANSEQVFWSCVEKCRLTVFSHKAHEKISESSEIILIKLHIITKFGMRLLIGLTKKKAESEKRDIGKRSIK